MVRYPSVFRANTYATKPGRDGRRKQASPKLPFIVAEVIHLAYPVRQDPVSSNEVTWINRSRVAQSKRPILKDAIERTPCAVHC
jgi:hypothetical protein